MQQQFSTATDKLKKDAAQTASEADVREKALRRTMEDLRKAKDMELESLNRYVFI